MTKVDIFSGFLGAGKTTLIKKLIAEAYQGEKLVIIENEFGKIGIDGGFLQEAGIEITEMNSGCICCSLVGDFGEALKKVQAEFAPDRILIEPSGVGKLSDVIRAVEGADVDGLTLNAFTTVIDATKCKMYQRNFAEFYENQIACASSLILSRTDGIRPEKLAETVAIVRALNQDATLITTPWDQLNGQTILDAMEKRNTLKDEMARLLSEQETHPHHEHHHHEHECHDPDCDCHHEHHHHHADDVFASWGTETAVKTTEAALSACLDALMTDSYGIILRAKGILPTEDGRWIHFDYVPGEKELRYGSADVIGKLCVIGTNLNVEGLQALFIPA